MREGWRDEGKEGSRAKPGNWLVIHNYMYRHTCCTRVCVRVCVRVHVCVCGAGGACMWGVQVCMYVCAREYANMHI